MWRLMLDMKRTIIVPEIDPHQLPPDEQDAARNLNDSLRALPDYANQLRSAVSLFENCDRMLEAQPNPDQPGLLEMFWGWKTVAARDGAMTIWHFGKRMAGAQTTLMKHCPTVSAAINRSKLKMAGQLFRESFLGHEDMRHGVAHAGEMVSTPELRTKNAFYGSYESETLWFGPSHDVVVSDILIGNHFTTMGFDGKIVSYELSSATAQRLDNVLLTFLSAFDSI